MFCSDIQAAPAVGSVGVQMESIFLAVMKMFDDKKIGFFTRLVESGGGGIIYYRLCGKRLSSAIGIRQQRFGE